MGLKSWYNGFGPRLRNESFAWLRAEIAAGRVPPPLRCQACGEGGGHLDYHTEDYSRPFGPRIHGFQLCFRCHMTLHARFRDPAMWFRYIDMLEAGAVYEPLWSRREIGKIWAPGWVERTESMGPPRGKMAFFRSLTMDRGYHGGDAGRNSPVARQALLFDDIEG